MSKLNWSVFYVKDKDGLWKSRRMTKCQALDYLEIFPEACYIQKLAGWFKVGQIIKKKEVAGRQSKDKIVEAKDVIGVPI